MKYSIGADSNPALRIGIAGLAVLVIVVSIFVAKQRSVAVGEDSFAAEPLDEDDVPATVGAGVPSAGDADDDGEAGGPGSGGHLGHRRRGRALGLIPARRAGAPGAPGAPAGRSPGG